VLTGYFLDGLAANDRLLYLGDDSPPDVVAGYLTAAGLDVDRLTDRGQLTLGDARGVYLPGGVFDRNQVIAGFRERAAAARGDGYRALRAAAEISFLVDDHADRDGLLAYELGADTVVAETGMIGLCAYQPTAGDTGLAVAACHPARLGAFGPAVTFHIAARPGGGLVVGGEVDISGHDLFETSLRGALAAVEANAGDAGDTQRPLVIDLAPLEFLDVGGITALARAIRGRDAGVEIHHAPDLVRDCWGLLGLDEDGTVTFVLE